MLPRTYSQAISDAQVMLAGITTHQDKLKKRGIDDEFTDDLQATINDCVQLNNEQEALKAKLKVKTAELNNRMANLKAKTSEARTIVKLDLPQTSWKEFGILVKR